MTGKRHPRRQCARIAALALAALAPAALAPAALAPAAPAAWPGTPPPPGRRLVWSDEFDRPGPPDPAKWGYEKGFVRNREAQCYTAGRPENARVENGCLVIEARREAYAAPDGTTARYTSASLTTEGRFSFARGRVEVRAKLPRGRGMWPAIWMLGDSRRRIGWPRCGEIDIMEFVGHKESSVHATVHWFDPGKNRKEKKGAELRGQNPGGGFHLYALEWTPDRLDFFCDGNKYFSFPIAEAGTEAAGNPFHKPHFLLINLAVGGSWGGRKGIDDACFPQRYEIDYVRVYR